PVAIPPHKPPLHRATHPPCPLLAAARSCSTAPYPAITSHSVSGCESHASDRHASACLRLRLTSTSLGRWFAWATARLPPRQAYRRRGRGLRVMSAPPIRRSTD